MECKACVEMVARLARWVFKVFPAFLAVLALWASKVHLVQSELQAQSGFVASRVSRDQ